MTQKDFIKKLQTELNEKGEKLKVDGVFGPKTAAALEKYNLDIELIGNDMTPPKDIVTPEKITKPTIVVVKGVRFKDRGKYRTRSGMFKGMTLHYAVCSRSQKGALGTLSYLAQQGFGCMTMDDQGVIYIPEGFDVFKSWGYHSGVSKWKEFTSVSDYFAGMEVACWGRNPPSSVPDSEIRNVTTKQGYVVAGKYQMFTKEQEESFINFCLWAKQNNPEFDFDYIAGHDELRREAGKLGDKQDPGGSLSMTMPQLRDILKKKYKELVG